jgi:hypothetical protein
MGHDKPILSCPGSQDREMGVGMWKRGGWGMFPHCHVHFEPALPLRHVPLSDRPVDGEIEQREERSSRLWLPTPPSSGRSGIDCPDQPCLVCLLLRTDAALWRLIMDPPHSCASIPFSLKSRLPPLPCHRHSPLLSPSRSSDASLPDLLFSVFPGVWNRLLA